MQQGIFKKETALEKRVELSTRLRGKYPERVPIILETVKGSTLILTRKKFLAPETITMGAFLNEIRKHSNLKSHEALFLFCGKSGTLIPTSAVLLQVYSKHKDEDGLLYITATLESTFGGLSGIINNAIGGAVNYVKSYFG